MRRLPIAVAMAIIAVAVVATACGSDDENTTEPTGTITGGNSAAAAEPELPEGVSRLAEGASSTALLPGAVTGFDPIDFPLEEGAEPPPCSAFVFTFTWQVAESDAGSGLVWRLTETGAARDIGAGPSGSATVGCGLIEAVNNGGQRISLDVHYLIGRRSE